MATEVCPTYVCACLTWVTIRVFCSLVKHSHPQPSWSECPSSSGSACQCLELRALQPKQEMLQSGWRAHQSGKGAAGAVPPSLCTSQVHPPLAPTFSDDTSASLNPFNPSINIGHCSLDPFIKNLKLWSVAWSSELSPGHHLRWPFFTHITTVAKF